MTGRRRRPIDDLRARRRILAWRRLVPAWRRWALWSLLGRDFCPYCRRATRWHFHAWNPIHPDGVPVAMWWECADCRFSTGPELSPPFARAMARRERRDDA